MLAARSSRAVALISILLSFAAHAQNKPQCRSTVVGDLRIEHFEGKIFSGTHTLRVWLPPGYSDAANSNRKYPVLYMLDGQYLFDVCTSEFGSEWQIDETLTRLIQAGAIEPLIVVGIDHAGEQRLDEFLPYADAAFHPDLKPHGNEYPRFLADEIVPRIAQEYRVRPGRTNTAIGGSSYGAIVVLDALITRPMMFGRGLIESPSAQVGNGALVRDSRDLELGPERIYIGVGTEELISTEDEDRKRGLSAAAINSAMVRSVNSLAANFRADGSDVKLVIALGAHHSVHAWAERFAAAIQFLFPAESGAQSER